MHTHVCVIYIFQIDSVLSYAKQKQPVPVKKDAAKQSRINEYNW